MKIPISILALSLAATAPAMAQTQTPPFDMLFQPPQGQTLTNPAPPTGAPPQPQATLGAVPPSGAFVTQVAAGTQFVMQASQLALSKAQSPAVRYLAELLLVDHGRAAARLQELAYRGGLPQQERPTPLEVSQRVQQLQFVSGADFDRAYLAAMVLEHQQAAALLRTYAGAGDNPRLRIFARRALPMIVIHLRIAERLLTSEPMLGS